MEAYREQKYKEQLERYKKEFKRDDKKFYICVVMCFTIFLVAPWVNFISLKFNNALAGCLLAVFFGYCVGGILCYNRRAIQIKELILMTENILQVAQLYKFIEIRDNIIKEQNEIINNFAKINCTL